MTKLGVLAFSVSIIACGATDSGTSAEALEPGEQLSAYGMNYGGVQTNDYHPEGLAAAHMGLERAWWQMGPQVNVFDAQVLRAAQANVTITPMVFALIDGGYTPANRLEWKVFVKALVTRFGPKTNANTGTFWRENPTAPYLPVRAWEIWNEENTSTFWSWDGSGTVSPENYHDALRAAHQMLRAVDPTARVIFGGLVDFQSSEGHNALDFLAQITNMAHGNCLYDAVAIHPYSNTVQTAVDRVQQTRTKLDGMGMPDVDIWVTEIGWAVGGVWQNNLPTDLTVPDEASQSAYLAAFANAMDAHRDAWRIGPTMWFTYQDLSTTTGIWDHHAGLFRLDGQGQPTIPRQAWYTAGQIAGKAKLVNLPKLRCPGGFDRGDMPDVANERVVRVASH